MPYASVIIASTRRPQLLRLALNGLTKQTYSDFECILVIKDFNDAYSKVIDEFSKKLDISVIEQRTGYVTTALNIGLRQARGQIVAFLDDDAIPETTWLESHIKTYALFEKVGGVAGKVVETKIENGHIEPLQREPVAANLRWFLVWPIDPLKGYSTYLTRGGLIYSYGNQEYFEKVLRSRIFSSMLWFGANMSILKKAFGSYVINETRVMGLHFEQEIAYLLFKKSYRVLCNLEAVVFHLIRKETLSRFYQSTFKCAQFEAEKQLFYYILKKSFKAPISPAFKLVTSTAVAMRCLSQTRRNSAKFALSRFLGILTGNMMGIAYMLGDGGLQAQFKTRDSLLKMNRRVERFLR